MVLSIYVTKADGTTQLFEREKVVNTCLRMGATRTVAELVATKIESKIYNGVDTRRILQMIFRYLRKHKPVIQHQIDLRKALSLFNPAPEFEHFIQVLLNENGYKVSPNQIVKGRCVEHEIDAIARKNGQTCLVEIKHHYNYHTTTSLDVSRISRAVFEDVTEGYELGLNDLKIDFSLIICNTKLSEHARRYADCRGISHIGWGSPKNRDLQTLISKKKLYPVTLLKKLNSQTKHQLTSNHIMLLRDLIEKNLSELRKLTGISKEKLQGIVNNAREIMSEK
ncbi:MAG: restriction endonuclease [Candidatus Bathyarchaeota archaeon]